LWLSANQANEQFDINMGARVALAITKEAA